MAGAARGAEVPVAARDALDWLERLPPPVIAAPRGESSRGYTVFVPNNDLDAALSGRQAPGIEDAVASILPGRPSVPPVRSFRTAALLRGTSATTRNGRGVGETAGNSNHRRGIDADWASDRARGRHGVGASVGHGGIVYHPSAVTVREQAALPATGNQTALVIFSPNARPSCGGATQAGAHLRRRQARFLRTSRTTRLPDVVFAFGCSDALAGLPAGAWTKAQC